jgi:hypothetical protein
VHGEVNLPEKCARIDCALEGNWRPVFIIPPPRGTHPNPPLVAIRAGLGLVVCGYHAATTKLSDYLSDEGWERITETCRSLGRALPRREDVTLAFFHRADAEFHEFDPNRVRRVA